MDEQGYSEVVRMPLSKAERQRREASLAEAFPVVADLLAWCKLVEPLLREAADDLEWHWEQNHPNECLSDIAICRETREHCIFWKPELIGQIRAVLGETAEGEAKS